MSIISKFKAFMLVGVVSVASLGLSQKAEAGGFPVIDVASIAQLGVQLEEMYRQYRMLENQYDTLTNQYDAIKGMKFESLIHDAMITDAALSALSNLYREDANSSGLGLRDDSPVVMEGDGRYKYLTGAVMFPDNPTLANRRQSMIKSVYFADETVKDTLDTMPELRSRYTDIANRMRTADDPIGRETISNNLALENGRALAKMIELQAVQINLLQAQLAREVEKQEAAYRRWGYKNSN